MIKFCLFRFVSAALLPPNEDLKGNEVEIIIEFKNSLGIDDPDAAAMHMEVMVHLSLFRTFYA